jgi:hypothetical protein
MIMMPPLQPTAGTPRGMTSDPVLIQRCGATVVKPRALGKSVRQSGAGPLAGGNRAPLAAAEPADSPPWRATILQYSI